MQSPEVDIRLMSWLITDFLAILAEWVERRDPLIFRVHDVGTKNPATMAGLMAATNRFKSIIWWLWVDVIMRACHQRRVKSTK